MAESAEKQCDLDNFVIVDKVVDTQECAVDKSEPVAVADEGKAEEKQEMQKEQESVSSATDATKEDDQKPSGSNASKDNVITQEEWSIREKALLEKIKNLQCQQDDNSNKGLQLQLKVKCEENEILRAKLTNTQTELSACLKKPNAKNKDIVNKIKKQHEELLTKARGMIFDKTKVIKNQELQIEALLSQVSSLKEVASITKNLLEVRNLEVAHLQERIEVVDMKMKVEKDRYELMLKKVNAGTELNAQLKKEYQMQLTLFKELKERYEQKFAALEANLLASNAKAEEMANSEAAKSEETNEKSEQ